MNIIEKLDALAEYYSQKDALELRKRKLLDEVKIPEEIQQIVKSGMKLAQEIEAKARARIAEYNKTIDAEVEAMLIPDELRAALDELREREAILMRQFGNFEKQRQEIAGQKRSNEALEIERLQADRYQLDAEIKEKTAKVYADIASRKNDIEIEFSGKADDVQNNINKLEAEIKAETKTKGETVKGKHFMAVYVKGRITWNTDKMEAWIIDHPFLKDARKEGEPSITLRKV